MKVESPAAGSSELIQVSSLVSHRTRKPIVEFHWGKERGQIDAKDAITHAINVLEAAEAAQTDAFLFEFATKRLLFTEQQAAALIADFRAYRDAMLKEGSKP